MIDFNTADGRMAYRHTSAHIMAQAVKRLWPDTQLAIGPAIEDGFYYDFDREKAFDKDDLDAIEKEMKKIIKEALPVERFVLDRASALEKMHQAGEKYKVELIEDLPEDEVLSFYKQGEFVDLCAGDQL